MKSIIKAENIHKNFNSGKNEVNVLNGISFEINKGDFVSIMGPSGCGKSTLLYLLGGLDKPSEGKVCVDSKDINKMKDKEKSKLRRADIGFVFQFYNLVENLTVEENILLPIVMDGGKATDFKKELDEILEIIDLSHKRKEIPSKLSGGQQQRVAIARAVINNPSVILADEPIGNLDSKSGKIIMELFKKINIEKGITILQVTHSEENIKYGNRLIRLLDGNVLEDRNLDNKDLEDINVEINI